MICLDNSVLSRFASPEATPAVDEYLTAHASEPWVVPATVAFEYYAHYETQGEIRTQERALTERFDGILPLTNAAAAEAAQMRVSLSKQNISLNIADLLHAATAREAGATFVTCDADDFDKQPIRELLSLDIVRP